MTNDQGVSQSLRTLFHVGTLSGLTDGQLLDRFAAGRGGRAGSEADTDTEAEAAFTALVERHGPMVLGVCRAVLGDRHDAEDACQATFLVLAHQAGLIRRRDSVASWLYGVARRVALRARRRAARRRELERRRQARVGPAEPVAPPPAEPWPELYEELDRLPEPFRAAVVLCDLEGHSYEQAAGILRCPVGTIQSRLARGRERLRGRLERRGAPLPPLWGKVPRSGGGGDFTPTLTLPHQGGGVATGAAHALAGAEIRRHVMIRVLTRLTALMLAGLVAATTIGLAMAGRDDQPVPREAVVAENRPEEDHRLHIAVRDAQGNGVPGITIELYRWRQPRRELIADGHGRAIIARDDVGDRALLAARRDGESVAWAAAGVMSPPAPAGTEVDPLTLKLLALNHRVEGSVVDLKGRPIAGARIEVTSLPYPIEGRLHMPIDKSERLIAPALTDDVGRFVLMLPEGVGAGLKAFHPRYFGPGTGAQADTRVLDRLVLEPAGGIAGTVTDAAGRPVAGAVVDAELLEHRVRIVGAGGEAVSDERGRFLLGGLEPGVYNLVLAEMPGRAEATARAVEGLRVRAGANTPADLTVIEGRPLRGVVIDSVSEQPVPGIHVGCYGPAFPNSSARVDVRTTDKAGRFTFHVTPGEQHVYVMDGTSFSRLSRRDMVVPERGPIEPVRLLRTAENHGGPMEKMMRPVPPAVGKAAVKAVRKVAAAPVAEAATKKERPAGDRAKVTAIAKAAEPDPAPKVRTVTGHVRDPQGRPMMGVQVYVNPERGAAFERFNSAATDRDGMFLLDGLPRRPLQLILKSAGLMMQGKDLPPDRDQVKWTYRLEPDRRRRSEPAPVHDEPIPPGLRERLTFIDLDRRGNDYLADGPGGAGNDLNRLPRGIHKLGDGYFRIGEKMVHVQGSMRPDMPQSVKGIPIQARGDRLHILHATEGATNSGTLIGAYVIRYADGSSEQIPLIYGRNLVNWWSFPRKDDPTEAQTPWTGSNDWSDGNPRLKIRLFAINWTNPHPEKQIAALDVLSAGKDCDPFLVALTLARP
jgi:RNA polymerase sigma factor (sigma-70 family)